MEMKIYSDGEARVFASYGDLVVKTDQAKSSGGNGEFPEPFDLFLASIGTCSGIYVYRFCQQRKISTENIYLTLKTNWNEEKRLIDRIDIDVQLPDDFPDKYKKAIRRAIDLCSVKKHMVYSPEFVITTTKE